MNVNIIDYLTDVKGLKQIDIAKEIHVSTVQVSKWKKNYSDIPKAREAELLKLADLWWSYSVFTNGLPPEWAILIKTKENHIAWHNYFIALNTNILDNNPAELWHHSFEDMDIFIPTFLALLNRYGFKVPEIAPTFPIDPKLQQTLDLSDNKDIQESRKFDELARVYWIENYNLRMKTADFESKALNRFRNFNKEFTFFKIILEDFISLPFPEEPFSIIKYRNATYALFLEIISDVQSEVDKGLDFDMGFFDSLIDLPKPIYNTRIGIIRSQLGLNKESNEESDTAIESDKKLKNISITDIEKIIAKAISEKLETTYSVKINNLEFDTSSHSSLSSDRTNINLVISKDRLNSNLKENRDQYIERHIKNKKLKQSEDLERFRERSIKKRDAYISKRKKEAKLMTKRKSISKKNKFEIFKRDKFTCQFCGSTPPGVKLEIDHIKPVCKGGTNELINLVTSCFDCNRGKGPRELDDDSAIVAQKNQLDLLQEKREQMDLMLQWSDELRELDNELNNNVIKRINEKMAPFSISENYKQNIANITKKHTLADILKAIDIAAEKYLKFDFDGSTIEESARNFVNKISGVLFNLNKSELERKISYIKGICRNRFSYWNDVTGAIILKKYVSALKGDGWSDDEIVQDLNNEIIPRTIEAKHWTEWKELLERWTQEIQEDTLDSELEEENEQAEREAQNIANDAKWDLAKKCAQELIDSRNILIEGFHTIGENFKSFNPDEIDADFNMLVLAHINHFIEDPLSEEYSYQKLEQWEGFYSHFEDPSKNCKFKDPSESLAFFLIDPLSKYLYKATKYDFNSEQLHHLWGCFFNAIATPTQRDRFSSDEYAAKFIREIIETQNIWLEKSKLNAA